MPDAPPKIPDWRTRAKELAATLAALPANTRHAIEDTMHEAVCEIHRSMAEEVNEAGAVEQLLCLFEDDSVQGVEQWLQETIACYAGRKED